MTTVSMIQYLASGLPRTIDLSASGNALLTNVISIGTSGSNSTLTKTILDALAGTGGSVVDASAYHQHDGRYFTQTQLGSTTSGSAGSTLVGDNNSYTTFTPATATVKGALSAIDTELGNRIRKDGSVAFTANQSMGNHNITNLADPVNPQDAATKNYADNLAQGLSWKEVVRSATTSALPTNTYSNGSSGVGATLTGTANGALAAQDGVTLAVNDRLLVKNEATAANNGIYVVTQVGDSSHPYILTRATDSNTASKLQWATTEVGPDATTQGGQIWRESNDINTIGTDAANFSQVSQGISYSFGNGLQTVGSTVSVKNSDASIAVASGGISVVEDPAGAIVTGGSGIKVQVLSTGGLQISSNSLAAKLADNSLTSTSSGLAVQLNAAGALTTTSTGLQVNVASTGGLQITTNSLAVKINGNSLVSSASGLSVQNSATGAITTAADGQAVQVDNASIDINGSNQLEVKAAGITAAKLASSVAGNGLTGGAGTALTVNGVYVPLTNANAGTLAAGTVVYISANNSFDAANASSSSTSTATIGVLSASTATSATGSVQVAGICTPTGGGSFTAGQRIYVSTTSGQATATAPSASGQAIFLLGVAVNATQVLLQPQLVAVLS